MRKKHKLGSVYKSIPDSVDFRTHSGLHCFDLVEESNIIVVVVLQGTMSGLSTCNIDNPKPKKKFIIYLIYRSIFVVFGKPSVITKSFGMAYKSKDMFQLEIKYQYFYFHFFFFKMLDKVHTFFTDSARVSLENQSILLKLSRRRKKNETTQLQSQ